MTVAAARWEISVFVSKWRNRLHYLVRSPFAFRNWWDLFRAKTSSTPTLLEARDGTRFLVRPGTTDLTVVCEAVILDPYLAPGYIRLNADATVIDVGANIGDFTMRAATLCPRGHVYAVDPLPGNCDQIRQHIKLNKVHNVTVVQRALGGSDGEIELHDEGSQSSAYWGSGRGMKVQMSSLATLIRENNLTSIDLLKMDCEGAEWDIMPGSSEVLPMVKQICLEYHNGKLNANWLQEWLQARGYRVARTTGEWCGLLWAWRDTAKQP